MTRQDPARNTYEESPDELVETLKSSKNDSGRKPKSTPSRDALLQDHVRHLKFLTEGPLPSRNFILPLPYPPSNTPISKSTWTHIADLCIGARAETSALLVRTITEPYVYSSSVTIVEDKTGAVARLTVCNLEDSQIDPILPIDSVLAIKQPTWTRAPGGSYYIRVDHPSDLVCLDPEDEKVPSSWRKVQEVAPPDKVASYKREGDMMFLKKKFRKARELYDRALAGLQSCPDSAAQVDLYRKRCGINLVLLRFDDAAEDLSLAISLHSKTASSSPSNLENPAFVRRWLHDRSAEDTSGFAAPLPKPLRDLAARIKFDIGLYQSSDAYDLQAMSSYVGPLTMHVDAANYVCNTEVKQTSSHGRGLFAVRQFKTGDLIMAEKAFALPGYFFNNGSSECSLYSLGDATATDRAGALLLKELVQKLRHNVSLRKEFFEMDDGGYWEQHGWTIDEGDDVPVDVFRIEHIRRRNCFSAPIRSLDLLATSSAVRNGFWIHTSYINHACLPNSVRTFIGDILLLRATRDIAAGEEISAQYVAPDLRYDERQQRFKGTWGFECDCTLCALDKSVGKQMEERRMTIFEELKASAQKLGGKPTVTALKKLTRRLRDLEALYGEDTYAAMPRLCLVHPTLFLTEAWRSLKHTDKMIESATRLLKFFGIQVKVEDEDFDVARNVGLINVECVRALKYMAEGYVAQGKTDLADKIRGVAIVWFRVITGADVGAEEFMKT